MSFNLFLNQYKQKKGAKKTYVIPVDLEREAKQYMQDYLEGDLSQIDIYDKERQACTEIRLNVNVTPICSNVLTNYKTEVVRYEGSDSAVSLTFNPLSNSDAISGTTGFSTHKDIKWNDIESVRDTQLSRSGLSYTYHCGLDIFSNYHFRVNQDNFKTVCDRTKDLNVSNSNSDKVFNTLFDYMREYDGSYVYDYDEYANRIVGDDGYIHLFTAEEVLSPSASVDTYQREENGWYGFKNISKLKAYENDHTGVNSGACLDIQAPICNRSAYDFIDLTPERDLFNFYPKWNEYRSREEKNWNYCITYPYSSTTYVSFIRQSTDSLKIATFDDYSNNGYTYFTTICKHGLNEGDFVNIYEGDNILISKAKVAKIGSGDTDSQQLNKQFIFSIKTVETISDKWFGSDGFSTLDEEDIADIYSIHPLLEKKSGITETYGDGAYYTRDGKFAYDSDEEEENDPILIIDNSKICLDGTNRDLSMKKIENGMECTYYVRINAKLPNFKNASEVIDEYNVQNSDKLLEDYSMHSNNLFSNENAQLAFAKTIYGDNVGDITYTENIPFNYLLDNRGIVLSDIFFTIFKNNKGYKDWYQKQITTGESIEYSHVFGKLSCAFELSPISERLLDTYGNHLYSNIHTINNIDSDLKGLDISVINKNYRDDSDDVDEINWEKNRFFYNDLVCYSRAESQETTIQQVQYRFNTAQRELGKNTYFSGITFDTIVTDDYDVAGFQSGTTSYNNGDAYKYGNTDIKGKDIYNLFYQREGYYYQPHYRIPVRTVSASKTKTYSTVVQARKDSKVYNDTQLMLITVADNYAENQNKVVLYNSTYKTYFYGWITEIKNTYTCVMDLYKDYQLTQPITGDELTNLVTRIQNSPKKFYYIKPNSENSYYADFLEDGSFMFQWREVVTNGYDDNDEEVYPFANDYLYVDKKITFFLRRQWWDRLEEVNTGRFPAEHSGKAYNSIDFDESVDSDDIDCLI